MRRFLPLAIAAIAAAPAAADEVELTNGRKISNCIAIVQEGKVRVEVGGGSMTFDEKDVVAIRPGDCPLKEVPARMDAAKAANTAKAWFDFASWCGSAGIPKHVRAALEKVIQLDPNHSQARAQLGHRKVQGKWLWGDALQQALGLVKFEGRWMTPIEMELIRSKRIAARERELDDEAKRELRRADAEIARAERDLRIAELRRLWQLETERRHRRGWTYGYGLRHSGWWDGATIAFSLYDLVRLKGGAPPPPLPSGQSSDLPGLKPTPALPGQ